MDKNMDIKLTQQSMTLYNNWRKAQAAEEFLLQMYMCALCINMAVRGAQMFNDYTKFGVKGWTATMIENWVRKKIRKQIPCKVKYR